MADLKAELLKSDAPIGVSSGSLQTGADGSQSKSTDVSKTLLKQIEYYFSNNNLWRDQFLMGEISKDPEGWVPISLVSEFSRIKSLSSDLLQICSALRQSKKLELSRDLFKVRRIHVVPPYNPKKDAKRTIYVDKLPPGSTLKSVRKLFSKFGRVTYVTKVDPLGSNVTPSTDVRDAPPQEVSNTAEITTALVEFAKKEAAKKAITMIQAHNIKKGIIFPATPTAASTVSPLLPSPQSGSTPTTQPVVAYETPFEIKALDFKLKKDSPVTSPTTGGGFTTSPSIKVIPASPPPPTHGLPTSPPASTDVVVTSVTVKETQSAPSSAPSSVSSSPATSPPSVSTSAHHSLISPVGSTRSSLSPHASPFVPSSPAASTSVGSTPSITPVTRRGSAEVFTPQGSPFSSPGVSPTGSPTSTPSGSATSSGSPPTPPGSNSSPPKEIDINLYTGFHILTKMSYLKKLGQLVPHPSDASGSSSVSQEMKKALASGGKQSPFRNFGTSKPSPTFGSKPSPRHSPFTHDEDGSSRPRGHNRSHSNPYPSTYPSAGIGSPPHNQQKPVGGRATPDRVGGRATPDRSHPTTGRATPDRGGRATPTERGSGGRATPDRSGSGSSGGSSSGGSGAGARARTPDRSGRSGTPDHNGTPDRVRNFLIPRPSSGSGHRREGGDSSRRRSDSGQQFSPSPRAPGRSGTPQQSPGRETIAEGNESRSRAGSDQGQGPEYYKAKYAEEKIRNEQLQKQLQKLLSGSTSADSSPGSPPQGGSGSPKSSPQKNRRRAKSSDLGGDKTERGYIPPVEEHSRPRLKLLSSRMSSSGVSIAQRFAQGPDETGGFLGGRGAGRGRGAPPSSVSSS